MRRAFPSLRLRIGLLLLALAALTSGCVYLRLLQLKNQLGDFDRHFRADIARDVSIECLKPLLLPGDLRWLGVEPEIVAATDHGETWHVRWLKEVPAGTTEKSVYDVELNARFAHGRLTHVDIPERYFAFFPKDLFVGLLRSTGGAKIDRKSRAADVEDTHTRAPDLKMPTLAAIEDMLGAPTTRATRDDVVAYGYSYKPVTTATPVRPIFVTFEFAQKSGELRLLVAKLPTGTLRFKMEPSKEKPAEPAAP